MNSIVNYLLYNSIPAGFVKKLILTRLPVFRKFIIH